MAIINALDRYKHFSEFDDPLVTGAGVMSPTDRRNAALANLFGGSDQAIGATGFPTFSYTTAATSGHIAFQTLNMAATGAGASIDGVQNTLTTAVALGTWANVINGKIDFGSAGSVTGLAAPFCSEIDLGAGCSAGTYSCFQAEIIMPAGALTGTQTTFGIFDLSGAAAATFDTNGGIFSINGVTPGSTKAVANNGSIGNINEITAGLRVFINGAAYYLLMATSADFVD